MKNKLLHYLKQIAQTLAIILIVSVAVDYWRKPSPPMNAADVPFRTLAQSQPTTLAALSHNQTLVVYFWGSWCGVCRHTSPVINELHQDGVPVLGVALRSGSPKNVADYLAQHQWQFDTLNDEQGAWSQQWQIRVTPTIVLIRNGKVVHSTTGLATYWGLKWRIGLANYFQAA